MELLSIFTALQKEISHSEKQSFLQRSSLIEVLINCQAGPDSYPFMHSKHHLTYMSPKQEVVFLRVCLSHAAHISHLDLPYSCHSFFTLLLLNFLCLTVWTLTFVKYPYFVLSSLFLMFSPSFFPSFFFLKDMILFFEPLLQIVHGFFAVWIREIRA